MTVIQRIGSGLAGVGKLGGRRWVDRINQLRQRAAAGDQNAQDVLSVLGVASITMGSGMGAFATHKLGLGRLLGATGGAVLGAAPALASREKKTPVMLPGFSVDSESSEAKMSAGSHNMNKSAAGGLLKLDAKGISPAALQAVYSRDTQGAMQHPGVVALVSRRRERIRRLTEELKNPMSHLKPEKETTSPMEEVAEMAGSPQMPMAPGGPQAPSNMLGMFGPETGGMGVPAAGAAGMPASGMLPKFGSYPAELVKRSDEEDAAPTDETRGISPEAVQQLVNEIVGKGQDIGDEDVHSKAEELGADPHEAEEEIYKLLAALVGGENDVIPGGEAEGMPTSMFPAEQIAAGTEVEQEHTPNKAVAAEIAKDHLTETDDYYEPRLASMEAGVEQDKDKGKAEGVGEEKKEARVNAYKYGFFAKVAELGMLPSEFTKVAVGAGSLLGLQTAGKAVGEAGGMGKWTLNKLLGAGEMAVKTPLVLAPILGLLAGGSYRLLTAPEYETPKELRNIERTGLYKRLGREAKRRARRLQKKRLTAASGEEREIKVPSIEAEAA